MKIKTYQNGLRLVVNSKKDADVVSFKVFVDAGAKDEKAAEYGYAHFLEHMFFNSTKDNSGAQILNKLDSLGAIKNAYTGIGHTCYYFKSISSSLEDCVKLFSQMFFNNSFKKDEVEKEKQVILEEYKMGEDNPSNKCILEGYKLMFNGTSFGHDTIGTPETISSVTPKKLLAFKKRLYKPQNVIISISGNITFKNAQKLVEKYFTFKFENAEKLNKSQINAFELTPIKNYVIKQKDNKQSVVYILTDLKEQTFHSRAVFRILYSIIGNGMSSKLFEIIRNQKGLVYSIDAGCTRIGKNFLSEIYFATSNEQVSDALIAIKDVLKDCAEGNITEEELIKTKNKYISDLIFARESNSNIAEGNGLDLLDYNKIITDKELTKEYMSVTLEEVINCAKCAYDANSIISAVGKCSVKDLKVFFK